MSRLACIANPPPGEEIVISGIAGIYPDSDNVADFADNLFNKVDLVTEDDRRFVTEHPEIPNRSGKINNIEKFDASFFSVHYKQAHSMDPMCRILMEKAYEAIVDAGLHPKQLRDTKCGVFIGSCFSESEKTWFYEKIQIDGFGITGCSRAMFANRISYWLGCTGPSYSIDTACSSSLYALENAYRAIRDGICDSAIVGGANLCLTPFVTLQFSRLGVLSLEGKCRPFDEEGQGYVRSEAISVILLQKLKDAKRNYGTVCYAKTNCDGYKPEGITYPSGKLQKELLETFYQECQIPPQSLAFVEAHGTGTRVGDPEEANTIDIIFTKGRDSPLKIGSVKSNIGHTEPASGVCSITKVIIAFETGYIPPNLHYNKPRAEIKGLVEGRMEVVSEKTKLEGDLIGINSFGFGGANAHALLRRNSKEKINNGLPEDNIPRLVAVSGRTLEAVNCILDDLEKRPVDAEYIRLLHDVHREEMSGHIYRGYILLQKNEPPVISREADHYSGEKRPIWFVFSGMGSQWPSMGASLMTIPVFAEAIEKCDKVLAPKGIDIYKIICDNDPNIFDNILHSFVGIAAIQIGLVDILTTLGILPDYIIGHSVGELGCAYADGCFTAEQMILAAYSRGLASLETKLIHGAMAAIGLGYNDIKDLCPPEIDVACHNSKDSSTISGPAEVMGEFLKELQAKGIFAREVNASNIAYHSRYIADAGPRLLKELKKVIPEPKLRSEKWISSSVPTERQNSDLAKYSSAEYHTNNLLSPVLFEESSRSIQTNAITIEIAPHGLLQAILRRSLGNTVFNVPLTQRGRDNTHVLLSAIGKLYMQGLQPNLAALYPDIQFPVSRGTPMISPLIKWEHGEDWSVANFEKSRKELKSGERNVVIQVKETSDWHFITGHVIDGRNLFPATGYLVLVWESLALMRGDVFIEMAVIFEDVRFIRATNVPRDADLNMTIMIQKGTGNFEVIESDAAVVTGRIMYVENTTKEFLNLESINGDNDDDIPLTTRDIYKELRLRGYNYQKDFRGIKECNLTGTTAKIQWKYNWITFMDNLLQLQIFHDETRGLFVPTSIQRMVIDPAKHIDSVQKEISRNDEGIENEDSEQYLIAYYYKHLNVLKSGGTEIRGLKAHTINRRKPLGEPVLEKQQFVPYKNTELLSTINALRICIQTALENSPTIKVKTVEIDNGTEDPLTPAVLSVLGDLPLIQADPLIISNRELGLPNTITVEDKEISSESNAMFVIDSDLSNRVKDLGIVKAIIKENGYIISRENVTHNTIMEPEGFDILVEVTTEIEKLILLRPKKPPVESTYIQIYDDPNFPWLEELKTAIKNSKPVVLYSQNEPLSGLIGLVNCIRKEPGGENVRSMLIINPDAPPFDPIIPFYKEQLDKCLAINIYKEGEWGCFRHLQFEYQTLLTKHAFINIGTRGDLSTLAWYEGPLSSMNINNYVDIYYAGLNFRDVMTATGKIGIDFIKQEFFRTNCVQGLEYSGRDQTGRRIMGMAAGGALATSIKPDPHLQWEIPDHWSLEDAATIPIAFGTAYYALIHIGQMKPGQSLLIHAGSGGVGQASITLALFHKCTVFTTVGTKEKREFIKKQFPQIPESHIGNSRDTSFEQMIMRETEGRGVDFVLNSLAEEKLQASLRCLGQGGKFLEIGKFDLSNNSQLGMQMFLKETSFYGIMLDNIFYNEPLKAQVTGLIEQGIKDGAIVPLPRVIFLEDEVEQAFRYMAAGKHIGKVLINIRPEEREKISLPKPRFVSAIPKFYCNPEYSYVIVGGLGGFGLELTYWMLNRGARKIVLSSRHGIVKGYQALRIKKWREHGAQIKISTADISTEEGCTALLHTAKLMGPVDGIFNLAVVLRDAILENQTVENFQTSFTGKVYGTKNLDKISRKMCPELKHFIVFSSVSCGRGNAGQTNYGMANSIMERICEQRHLEGFPALAIQWGAIGEVGLVADMQEDDTILEIGGTLQQRLDSCFEVLDTFVKQSLPVVASMVVAEKKSGHGAGENIVDCVANILGIRDIKTVSMHSTLAELGMDSMMAVEIKQTLEREYEVFLTAQDIRTLTFNRLQEIQNSQESNEKAENQNQVTGIDILIRNLGDEKLADQVLLKIPSLATTESSTPPIFLIAGIEGQTAAFNNLCKYIKFITLGLQLSYKNDYETIESMAESLYPTVVSNLKPGQEFYIVAYSYGCVVALELILTLEANGYKGRVLFIDGAPSVLKTLWDNQLSSTTETQLQTAILCALMNLIAPVNLIELKATLEPIPEWSSKVQVFLSRLPQKSPYSPEYSKTLCSGTLNRLKALNRYEPPNQWRKVKSPVSLVRPQIPLVQNTKDDYDLSQHLEQPVSVTFLDGNHYTILENKALAEIINNTFV